MSRNKWHPPIDYRQLDRRAMQLMQDGADLATAYSAAMDELEQPPAPHGQRDPSDPKTGTGYAPLSKRETRGKAAPPPPG